jgi:YesN/AraC family two-component response regulator
VKLYGSMILILDHQSSLDHVLNILEYRDFKYFAKLFKKHTGLTPDRFKNLYRSIYLHKETRSFEFDRVN